MIGIIYELKFPYGSYIGSTNKKLEKRIKQHKFLLKKNKHFNIIVQRAWNKYGEFVVEILETIKCNTDKEIRNREQYYLDTKTPLYNISKTSTYPDRFRTYQNLITKHYNSLDKTLKHIIVSSLVKSVKTTIENISKKYNVSKEISEYELNKLVGMGLLVKEKDRYYVSNELKEIFEENGITN